MHVTMTEYFAALGWPDPSSLETRTPRNKGQFVVHEELTSSNERDIYMIQMESDPTAMIGSSRCPVRTIMAIKYQICRKSIQLKL